MNSNLIPLIVSLLCLKKWPCDGPRWFKLKKMSKCQKGMKMSKRCQNVKKMSNIKKSNTQTMEEGQKKNKFTQWGSHILTSILTSNIKVTKIVQKHFLCTFWGFLVTIICHVKIDVNMCELHCVNLFFLWTSSIVNVFDFLTFDIFLTTWHLFDSLTSFWQLDIFFDIWAIGNVGKWVSWLILKIEMGYLGGWGTWVMGQWATWSMWSCAWSCATSLILHGSL